MLWIRPAFLLIPGKARSAQSFVHSKFGLPLRRKFTEHHTPCRIPLIANVVVECNFLYRVIPKCGNRCFISQLCQSFFVIKMPTWFLSILELEACTIGGLFSFQLRRLLPNQVRDIMYSVIYVPLFLLYVCHLSERGRTFPFIARWRAWVRNLQYVPVVLSGYLKGHGRPPIRSIAQYSSVCGHQASFRRLGEHSQPTHYGPPSRRVIIAIVIALPSSLYPLIWVNVYVLHHSTLIRKSPKSGQHQENPFFTFCAFSCFFMLFRKKVEKSRKSQVPYLPECFPRWW